MKKLKKTAVLLLSLLILVGCTCSALAETGIVLDISFEADEEQMATYDRDLGGDGSIGKAIAEFLNVLKTTVAFSRQDEVTFSLDANDTTLIDLATKLTENGQILIASSIIPGMTIDVTDDLGGSMDEISRLAGFVSAIIEQVMAQLPVLQNEAMAFLANEEPLIETGVFAGDAYTGGVERYTYRLDDRDLAFLCLTFLNKLEGMDEIFAANGFNWDEEKNAIVNDLLEIAGKNELNYVICVVYDEHVNILRSYQPDPIGYSMTVYRGEEQIATVSVSVADQGREVKVVCGFGDNGQVYYVEAQLNGTQSAGTFELEGTIDVWLDPYREGFRAASNDLNNQLGTFTIDRLVVVTMQETSTVVYDMTLSITGKKTIRETGRLALGPSSQWTNNLYYDGAETPMLKTIATLDSREIEPYQWPDGKVVDLSDENMTIDFFSALLEGITDLDTRMKKALPMDFYNLLMHTVNDGIMDVLNQINFD